MARYCLALDMVNDPALMQEYIDYHKEIWPEIADSIYAGGITDMEIFRTGDRMFMIMETGPDFSFEKKAKMDAENPKVQEWEALMWKFQKALPWAQNGEKWILMDQIFKLPAKR
jgi:L-rhamnose mutarotase